MPRLARPSRSVSAAWAMLFSAALSSARQSLGLAAVLVLVAAMIATAQLVAVVLAVGH